MASISSVDQLSCPKSTRFIPFDKIPDGSLFAKANSISTSAPTGLVLKPGVPDFFLKSSFNT